MTSDGEWVNRPEHYEELPEETKSLLAFWIDETVRPAASWNIDQSSYNLKHRFEDATGVYVTNGQFKGAMLKAGYEPRDRRELNWVFRVGKVRFLRSDEARVDWELRSRLIEGVRKLGGEVRPGGSHGRRFVRMPDGWFAEIRLKPAVDKTKWDLSVLADLLAFLEEAAKHAGARG